MAGRICVGTAGWSISSGSAPDFEGVGTHLQRYARHLTCAEINSSFYRPHRKETYARWAASTPPGFLFAVKVPRLITHELGLRRGETPFAQFIGESSGLGDRRGPLLVQLPPSCAFTRSLAASFFEMVRTIYDGPLVCEPRHSTWFTASVDAILRQYLVARVAADPARAPGGDQPAGWRGLAYFRLHGSPDVYWSSYDPDRLRAIAAATSLISDDADAWCVFDNTASGAAIRNACELQDLLSAGAQPDGSA